MKIRNLVLRGAVLAIVLAWLLGSSGLVHANGATTQPATGSEATTYKITPAYSNVSFSIMKFFFKEEGGFGSYEGKILFDPEHPERSRVSMAVQTASIDTRNKTRDDTLRSDDFFDAQRYPTLSFVSTTIKPRTQDEYDVTGDLTIHGVSKRITIPVHFLGRKQLPGWGDFVGFDCVFTIDRTEFGVNGSHWGGGNLVLGKEVTVHLAIGAMKEVTSDAPRTNSTTRRS